MSATEKKKNDEFIITGNWPDQARLIKRRFPLLTDADLMFEKGEENELLRRVEIRINKTREEVIRILQIGQITR